MDDHLEDMASISEAIHTLENDHHARRANVPVSIRSTIPLEPRFVDRIEPQLARSLGNHASLIQRCTVRFEDANGPKGGVDKICRIKLVLTGRPTVLIEKHATSAGRAFALAVQAVAVSVTRGRDKRVSDRLAAVRRQRRTS